MNVLDQFKLDGQVAIVTGGAQNLGRQHALALAEAGANVAICDLAEAAGIATKNEIEALGRQSWFGKVDVTRTEQIERFITEILSRFNKIDILVNNAAIPSEGIALQEVSDEKWRRIIDTNLSSLFRYGRNLLKHVAHRPRAELAQVLRSASELATTVENRS